MQSQRSRPSAPSKNMQPLIELSPSTTLLFSGKGVKEPTVMTTLELKNVSEKFVIYKIKTTKPKYYCVRPNSGFLAPSKSLTIQVAMQSFKEESKDYSKHKFQVQAAQVDEPPEDVSAAFKLVTESTPQQEQRLRCKWRDVVLDNGEVLGTSKKTASSAKPPVVRGNQAKPLSPVRELPSQEDGQRATGSSLQRVTNAADAQDSSPSSSSTAVSSAAKASKPSSSSTATAFATPKGSATSSSKPISAITPTASSSSSSKTSQQSARGTYTSSTPNASQTSSSYDSSSAVGSESKVAKFGENKAALILTLVAFIVGVLAGYLIFAGSGCDTVPGIE